MTVWVAMVEYYDDTRLLGVFYSEEAAERYVRTADLTKFLKEHVEIYSEEVLA